MSEQASCLGDRCFEAEPGASGNSGGFGRMLGRSPAMLKLYDSIARVAPTQATVLLIGESGTGKELAAQTIHDLSRRRRGKFLAVNCGAISPALIESELFGHERGSFTGAQRRRAGLFESARGGTLFLDEITEMPVEAQVKLLRVLETHALTRIGSTQRIDTNVRVIAATNRNPEEAIATKKLRMDLYHRLNVFPLRLPPLRERDGDTALLAEAFLVALNGHYGTSRVLSPAAATKLNSWWWPGNVRELKNFVHRMYILTEGDATPSISLPRPALAFSVGTPLAEIDQRLIVATLEQCGTKRLAAETLGISLRTLCHRLMEYGRYRAT